MLFRSKADIHIQNTLQWAGYNVVDIDIKEAIKYEKPEPTINDIKRQIEENEECGGCGFYTSDPDSQPLENCETCGRESV